LASAVADHKVEREVMAQLVQTRDTEMRKQRNDYMVSECDGRTSRNAEPYYLCMGVRFLLNETLAVVSSNRLVSISFMYLYFKK
jgi:hypothetical protein